MIFFKENNAGIKNTRASEHGAGIFYIFINYYQKPLNLKFLI